MRRVGVVTAIFHGEIPATGAKRQSPGVLVVMTLEAMVETVEVVLLAEGTVAATAEEGTAEIGVTVERVAGTGLTEMDLLSTCRSYMSHVK